MVAHCVGVSAVLATRPRDPWHGLPVPFVSEDDDGLLDHAVVVRRRAIRCGLSRICGICGDSLTWPVAFVGPDEEVDVGMFLYPPLHPGCAREALDMFGHLGGGYLGHPDLAAPWTLTLTSGFDLVRPNRRGRPVLFRPNSVIEQVRMDSSDW